ncbi:MAG: lamin tail domain-containing protein, partial [Myxococcales bacterium]|nr:lamin tail domain-containing protein [Myxococcales bacterium]
ADGGRTWTYCDGGDAGSSDGYDAASAGSLTVAEVDPCDPNPCDAPPATDCADDTTRRTYAAPGACEAVDGQAACSYPSLLEPCVGANVCLDGVCQAPAPRAPQAGEVIFTELMYDPHAPLADATAEWFELHNRTPLALDLTGCTVSAGAGQSAVGALVVAPGGYTVFTQDDDPALSGVANAEGRFNFFLSNAGATLTLTCRGQVIDTVTYDNLNPWPVDARRHSISLAPEALDAAANDDAANWCYGRIPYYTVDGSPWADHLGTPGAANPGCEEPVDFCQTRFPARIEGERGQQVTVYGRIYEEGTTDRSVVNDVRLHIKAQLGFGPLGSDPATWAWTIAEPNAGWTAPAGNGEDEYQAALVLPPAGDYTYAFRFSADGGRTWTLCDSDAEGSTDGFDEPPVMVTVDPFDPCEGACQDVPAAECADDTTVRTYAAPAACQVVDGQPVCTFDAVDTPCDAGQACVDGACVAVGPRAPVAGEVIFSELMYDPHGSLADGAAEWFELHNTAAEDLDLTGCAFTANGNGGALPALVIPAGGYVVVGQNADPAVNGGLQLDAVLGFALGNGGSALLLSCGGVDIDAVTYDDAAPWPIDAQRHSISLDGDLLDGELNDLPDAWCFGRGLYYADAANAFDDHRGTPGAANPPCDEAVDFCRLQFPVDIDGTVGDEVMIYGRLYEEGTTDRTAGTDARQYVLAQLGYGGDDPAGWVWLDAAPNADWQAPQDSSDDEYVATLTLPAEGIYAFGYRVSVDGGRTWTLCDGDAEGSTDGFDEPGIMLTSPPVDPCAGACQDAPPAECLDGLTARTYAAPGACEVVDGQPVCTFDAVDTACQGAQICDAGACVDPPIAAPAAGQVVITELMYDPHGPLSDNTAEWVELQNVTDQALSLATCTFTANGSGGALGDLVVEPGAYVLIARSADPALNGGIAPDVVLTFNGLGNGGSTLLLTCDGVAVDTVAYDDVAPWPLDAQRHSIALDGDLIDAELNDDGAAWCYGRAVYYLDALPAEDHRGTPGAANPPCNEAVDFCKLQFPTEIDGTEGDAVTVYGRLYEEGTTDRHTGNDVRQHVLAQFGWGADGVAPADWSWTAAIANPNWDGAASGVPNDDEYQATWILPAEGLYGFGYRFSVDGGLTWTLCDGDNEGSSDGFDAPGVALTAAGDPCVGVVCDTPPATECADADTQAVYQAQGVCEAVDGQAQCTYDFDFVACAAGTVCNDQTGACELPPAPAPQVGEVAFTEVMYDTDAPLVENQSEWFEIHNQTDTELDLTGCTIADPVGSVSLDGLRLPADGYMVFARSDDPALNGGIEGVARTFGFDLNNGGDNLTLSCAGVAEPIDVLVYQDNANDWPDARGASTQLDAMRGDEVDTNDGRLWCTSSATYGDQGHFGTPGAANHNCEVDFCRLQWNPAVRMEQGDTVTYYTQFYRFGVTDQADAAPAEWQVQLGWGPDQDAPDGDTWAWFDAAPNAGWDFAANANDEWQADFTAPEVIGQFDTGFRISTDGGQRWVYCDAGDAGNTDGFGTPGDLIIAAPAFTQAELQARFDQDCVQCHGFLANDFTVNTFNVASPQFPALPRIRPGVPEQSYLFLKITNTHGFVGGGGQQMPMGGPYWNLEDVSRLAAYIQNLQ